MICAICRYQEVPDDRSVCYDCIPKDFQESYIDLVRFENNVNHPKEYCWPSSRLERVMLEDADLVLSESEPTTAMADTAIHVKALLSRVRDLEQALRYAASCSTLEMVRDTARGMGVIE